MMIGAFCFTLLSLIVTTAARHECLAVTNYYVQTFDGDDFTSFSQFSVETQQGKNIVTVSNISVVGVNNVVVCVTPENQKPVCSDNLPFNVSFPLENSTFGIDVDFAVNKDEMDTFFPVFAMFDNGRFVFEDGGIFTPEMPCLTIADTGLLNRTSCCTSFIGIPDLPINAPTCKKFKSRSTVYNVNDNYSIFGSSQANFTRQGNILAANFTYTGTPEGGAIWAPNSGTLDCQIQSSIPTFCQLYGPQGVDGEWLLRGSFFNSTVDPLTPSFMIGRIIFSSNQTLMEEGAPFTPRNNCFYHSEQISASQVATSSICCTEFQQ